MEHFRSCQMDTFHAGGIEFDWPCTARIDADTVVVEYETADGLCTYRGESLGEGHYRLKKLAGKGDATLHRFPGSMILEGFWIEEAEQGMWRIRLLDTPPSSDLA